jgi:ribose/xylose/arabinose/galactoside ABC-type transport system permease subunit
MSSAPASNPPSGPFLIRILRSEWFVLYLCLVAFAGFAAFTPGFATPGNLGGILVAGLPLLVLATGQTIVLISGGIDLSAPAIVGLCSVLGALVMGGEAGWLRGHPAAVPVALAVMLGTGGLVGAFNGFCIARLRMPPFMVTLTTTMFFSGLAVWLAKRVVNAESIYQLPPAFLALGHSPVGVALGCLLMAAAAHLWLARTRYGRWLYAVGHNSRAALLSGVPVARVTILAYAGSGLFAALGAILLTARLETGSPNHGRALLLDVIGAVVLGGTSLFGGQGKVAWTAGGVLFLALLGNGLNLNNLSDFFITLIKGAVILLAALLDVWRTRLGRQNS